jgi:hypothetical protein
MIGTFQIRLTSALSTLAMLVVGIAPSSALAECGCAPGGCAALKSPKSGCCSTADERPAPKQCCEVPQSHAAPAKCCCTMVAPRTCSLSEQHRTSGGCECSPSRPSQAPAHNPSKTSVAKSSFSGELPPWANAPLCFDLNSALSLPTNAFLNTPPVPFRELYCVWRI